jgi:hypothetical protein
MFVSWFVEWVHPCSGSVQCFWVRLWDNFFIILYKLRLLCLICVYELIIVLYVGLIALVVIFGRSSASRLWWVRIWSLHHIHMWILPILLPILIEIIKKCCIVLIEVFLILCMILGLSLVEINLWFRMRYLIIIFSISISRILVWQLSSIHLWRNACHV